MYIIGLSGSGKSTIALALEQALREDGISIQMIDGDVLREELGGMFGYTKEERAKQGRVAWVLAKYLNQNGIPAVITAVAGYQDLRDRAREFLGTNLIQVYLDCPIEECIRRDAKGYYRNAGQLKNFIGISERYEIPRDSEITIDTVRSGVDESVDQIMSYLKENGFC